MSSRAEREISASFAFAANDDRLVRLAIDDQRCIDARAGLFFFPAVDRHRDAVRQFVAEQPVGLLADQFGRQKAHAAVGVLIGVEQWQSLGQQRTDLAEQIVELLAFLGADRNDRAEREALARRRHQRQQARTIGQFVGLVDRQNHALGVRRHQLQQVIVAALPAARFDHQHDRVHFAERRGDRVVHATVQRRAVAPLEAGVSTKMYWAFRRCAHLECGRASSAACAM
jgi:hypothetical protein